MKLALDAMGGDNAPQINIDGAQLALEQVDGLSKLLLVGDETILREHCEKAGLLNDPRVESVHASEVVTMEESGLMAVRQKKNSSMSVAVDLVKEGRADAVLSAGNTGAAVAASTIKLRLLPGIERAGIVSPIPTKDGYLLMSDTGANPDARPSHLVGYAVMASIMASAVYGHETPKLGLMSNGTEDSKGSEFTKETFKLLSHISDLPVELPYEFKGNCEGHDLFTGKLSVVLTDGFTGNIVLKTLEATAKVVTGMIKDRVKESAVAIMGAMLMKNVFRSLRARMSADAVGGSPLMGVNGLSIIAHGSANGTAICNAIHMAQHLHQHNVNERIMATMKAITEADAMTNEK